MKYLKLKLALISVFVLVASTSFTDNSMVVGQTETIITLPIKGIEEMELDYIEPVLI